MDVRGFCNHLLQKGWASSAQVQSLVEKYQNLHRAGLVRPIYDLAAEIGLLQRWHFEELRICLGSYELMEFLGKGNTATVYKCKDLRVQQLRALKIITPKGGSQKFLQRFQREVKTLISLDHPGLIKGYEYGEEGGVHYFAMELVEGKTLRERLEEEKARTGVQDALSLEKTSEYLGKLPRLREEEVLEIGRQMAEILIYLEERNLLHRDIKPENIMMLPSGRVKLCDLGLAKWMEEGAHKTLTQTGAIVGTPYYVSPEIVRGQKDIDIRSDIYSLGATLFHLLVGRPPFEGATPAVVYNKHLMESLPSYRELRELLPRNVYYLFKKMLSKEPEQRQSSALELREDFELVSRGEMPRGFEHKRVLVSSSSSSSRRGYIWFGVVGLILLAGVVWGYNLVREPVVESSLKGHSMVEGEVEKELKRVRALLGLTPPSFLAAWEKLAALERSNSLSPSQLKHLKELKTQVRQEWKQYAQGKLGELRRDLDQASPSYSEVEERLGRLVSILPDFLKQEVGKIRRQIQIQKSFEHMEKEISRKALRLTKKDCLDFLERLRGVEVSLLSPFFQKRYSRLCGRLRAYGEVSEELLALRRHLQAPQTLSEAKRVLDRLRKRKDLLPLQRGRLEKLAQRYLFLVQNRVAFERYFRFQQEIKRPYADYMKIFRQLDSFLRQNPQSSFLSYFQRLRNWLNGLLKRTMQKYHHMLGRLLGVSQAERQRILSFLAKRPLTAVYAIRRFLSRHRSSALQLKRYAQILMEFPLPSIRVKNARLLFGPKYSWEGNFITSPFVAIVGRKYYLYYVCGVNFFRGIYIACAESKDGVRWSNRRIVLRVPDFHPATKKKVARKLFMFRDPCVVWSPLTKNQHMFVQLVFFARNKFILRYTSKDGIRWKTKKDDYHIVQPAGEPLSCPQTVRFQNGKIWLWAVKASNTLMLYRDIQSFPYPKPFPLIRSDLFQFSYGIYPLSTGGFLLHYWNYVQRQRNYSLSVDGVNFWGRGRILPDTSVARITEGSVPYLRSWVPLPGGKGGVYFVWRNRIYVAELEVDF